MLTHENRNIKRHLNQIREAHFEMGDDSVANDPSNHDENRRFSFDEEEGNDSQIFVSPTVSADNSVNDSIVLDSANASIPDVVERPSVRECANKAKEAITSLFTSNRNR